MKIYKALMAPDLLELARLGRIRKRKTVRPKPRKEKPEPAHPTLKRWRKAEPPIEIIG